MPRTSRNSSGLLRLPISPEDVKLSFPSGRHPDLPDIYKSKNHVLSAKYNNIYYFIHDGSLEASEKTYNLEVNELKIPQGSHAEAVELGAHTSVPVSIYYSNCVRLAMSCRFSGVNARGYYFQSFEDLSRDR